MQQVCIQQLHRHRQRRQTLALLAGLMLAPAGARAHGEAHGGASAAAAKREQKPWGVAGDAAAATRRIVVRMGDDMRFTPAHIDVRLGETLHSELHNDGRVLHEFVLGTPQELQAHAALMARFPDMEHDEPYMAHVRPGQRGTIVWTFNRAGEFSFACLIAGHYSAGMVGRVSVSTRR